MKKMILDTVDDMVADFLYYKRKEDEDLPVGAIEKAIREGKITKEDIVIRFAQQLREGT
jgi:hypothetical protein